MAVLEQSSRPQQTACDSFRDMFQELGLCMKKSKEQPPNTQQKVLGVIITVRDESLMVEAFPDRKQKVLEMLEDMQSSNSLTPDQAQRITGKLAFLSTTFLGGL